MVFPPVDCLLGGWGHRRSNATSNSATKWPLVVRSGEKDFGACDPGNVMLCFPFCFFLLLCENCPSVVTGRRRWWRKRRTAVEAALSVSHARTHANTTCVALSLAPDSVKCHTRTRGRNTAPPFVPSNENDATAIRLHRPLQNAEALAWARAAPPTVGTLQPRPALPKPATHGIAPNVDVFPTVVAVQRKTPPWGLSTARMRRGLLRRFRRVSDGSHCVGREWL